MSFYLRGNLMYLRTIKYEKNTDESFEALADHVKKCMDEKFNMPIWGIYLINADIDKVDDIELMSIAYKRQGLIRDWQYFILFKGIRRNDHNAIKVIATDDRSADFIMKMFEEKEYTLIEATSSYVE